VSPSTHLAQNKIARITGGFYVAYILASVAANSLGHIGLGTAEQVYQSIVTNTWPFRLGLVVALTSGLLFLMVAWGLYVLLRAVNADLALLFLVLNSVGVAIQGASMLSLVSAMFLGSGASYMALLWPAYRAITYPGLAVSFVAGIGLALWLLIMGVKVVDSGPDLPG
jgi:hypothetical protein